MPSDQISNNDLITQILALTSYGGFIVLFFCFLLICVFGAISLVKIFRTQKRTLASIERATVRREDNFQYEAVRVALDEKITDIITREEHELGEYVGTDLIERVNHELDKEELITRAMPIGDPEAIARLKVIGDWRLELQKGLFKALTPVDES